LIGESGKGIAVSGEDVGGFIDGEIQIFQIAVIDAVDPSVDGEFLTAFPGFAGDGGVADVEDLFDDVEFAHAVANRVTVTNFGEPFFMFLANVLEVTQPIIAETEAIALDGGADAAATVVAADDDVADFENIDGELHHGEAIEVGMDDEIGDIAVDEEFPGQKADDLIGGDAAIGAADPEVAGRLLAGELGKKIGVLLANSSGPGFVVIEQVAKSLHSSGRAGVTIRNALSGRMPVVEMSCKSFAQGHLALERFLERWEKNELLRSLLGDIAGGGFGSEDHQSAFDDQPYAAKTDEDTCAQDPEQKKTGAEGIENGDEGNRNKSDAAEEVHDAVAANGSGAFREHLIRGGGGVFFGEALAHEKEEDFFGRIAPGNPGARFVHGLGEVDVSRAGGRASNGSGRSGSRG
jgi:hypothetical protein